MAYYSYNELYHHGVKGQKWGVRRYRNPDGSLTDEGRRHIYQDKIQKRNSYNKSKEKFKQTKKEYRLNKREIKRNKELSRYEKKKLINDQKSKVIESKMKKKQASKNLDRAIDKYNSEVTKKAEQIHREASVEERLFYGKDVWESAVRYSDANNVSMNKAIRIAKNDYAEEKIRSLINQAQEAMIESSKNTPNDQTSP